MKNARKTASKKQTPAAARASKGKKAPVAPVVVVAPSTTLCRPGSAVGKLLSILQSGKAESYNAETELFPLLGSKDPGQIINDLRRVLRKHGEGDVVLVGKGTYAFQAPTK